MPYAVTAIDEAGGVSRPTAHIDALSKPVFTVPRVASAAARQGVAVNIVRVGVCGSTDCATCQHVRRVEGIALAAVDAVALAQAVAHCIETITLRLPIPIIHRLQPVLLVITIEFGAARRVVVAIQTADLVAQALPRRVITVVVAHQQLALPLVGCHVEGPIRVAELHQPPMRVQRGSHIIVVVVRLLIGQRLWRGSRRKRLVGAQCRHFPGSQKRHVDAASLIVGKTCQTAHEAVGIVGG